MFDQSVPELATFLASLKMGLWLVCIPAWIFGAIERGFSAFSHHYPSATDLVQIFTALFFLCCWLLLKPKRANPA